MDTEFKNIALIKGHPIQNYLDETALIHKIADELKYHDVLSSCDFNKLKSLVSGYELLFIDEAQRIKDIGINLKITRIT